MRVIKFRVWDNEIKKYRSEKDGDYSLGVLSGKVRGIYGEIFSEMQVEQFTGLKDKNGVDVYEGDIVLFPNNSKVHIVDFYQSGFVLKSVDGQVVVYNIKPQYIEVVGNIYENAEMLSPTYIKSNYKR